MQFSLEIHSTEPQADMLQKRMQFSLEIHSTEPQADRVQVTEENAV